jgi:AMMECR1 domain-containing protein
VIVRSDLDLVKFELKKLDYSMRYKQEQIQQEKQKASKENKIIFIRYIIISNEFQLHRIRCCIGYYYYLRP